MRIRRLLPVLVAAVFLVGCGADTLATDTVGGTSPTDSSSAGSTAVTQLPLVGGGTIDPEALSMGSPVALWFWAPG